MRARLNTRRSSRLTNGSPPCGRRGGGCEPYERMQRPAKVGNRDERDPLPAIGPKLAVSGPDSAAPLSQDPAKARRFLGCSLVAGAKSLQPQTRWRSEWNSNFQYPLWGESEANRDRQTRQQR